MSKKIKSSLQFIGLPDLNPGGKSVLSIKCLFRRFYDLNLYKFFNSLGQGPAGQSPVLPNNLTFQELFGKTWDLDMFYDCGCLPATPIKSEMSTGNQWIATQKSLFSPLLSLYPASWRMLCSLESIEMLSLTRSIASSCHVSRMSFSRWLTCLETNLTWWWQNYFRWIAVLPEPKPFRHLNR